MRQKVKRNRRFLHGLRRAHQTGGATARRAKEGKEKPSVLAETWGENREHSALFSKEGGPAGPGVLSPFPAGPGVLSPFPAGPGVLSPFPAGPGVLSMFAADMPGEIAMPGGLETFGAVGGQLAEILSPAQTLINGAKSLWGNFKGIFKAKDKKALILAIGMAALWLVQLLLPHLGIDGLPAKLLSGLTFAGGGADGGILGGIGGLFGKGFFEAAVFSLFGGGGRAVAGGFRSMSVAFKDTRNLGAVLLGAGATLLLYQFFAGNATMGDSMAAVSGMVLAAKNLGGQSGFLFRFARSLTAKKAGGFKIEDNAKAAALLSGGMMGFGLGVPLSAALGYLPMLFGFMLLIAGLIVTLVKSEQRGAAA